MKTNDAYRWPKKASRWRSIPLKRWAPGTWWFLKNNAGKRNRAIVQLLSSGTTYSFGQQTLHFRVTFISIHHKRSGTDRSIFFIDRKQLNSLAIIRLSLCAGSFWPSSCGKSPTKLDSVLPLSFICNHFPSICDFSRSSSIILGHLHTRQYIIFF